MICDKRIAVLFRSIALILVFAGLYNNFVVFSSTYLIRRIMYYTMQSNFLVLLLFVMLLVRTICSWVKTGPKGTAGFFARFEMLVVVAIIICMLVYWGILSLPYFKAGSFDVLFSFRNLSVHLFTPLLCLADYLLFAPHGHLKYRDIYLALIFPLYYLILTTILGFSGFVYRISALERRAVRFPYSFYDYDVLGARAVLNILGLILFFLLVSHLIYFLDKKWKKDRLFWA